MVCLAEVRRLILCNGPRRLGRPMGSILGEARMSLTDWSDRLLFGHRIGLSCYRNFGFVTGKHENGSRIARGIAFEQLSGMVIHKV